MKLNWDGPHMPLLASMLVVPDAVAAGSWWCRPEVGYKGPAVRGASTTKEAETVLSDSEGEDATQTEQDIDLAALHTL
nr:hypothetical protein [Tanacetum cinerariifolium]